MMYVWLVVGLGALLAAFWFSPKGWRTVVVNAVAGGLAVSADLLSAVHDALPANWGFYAVIVVNCINIVLRRATTTPIGRRA